MKKQKLLYYMGLCLLGFSFSVEAAVGPVTDFTQPIQVSASDPEVIIRLDSNPSTGYQWLLVEPDAEYVLSLGSHYYPSDTRRMGAGGFVLWHFKLKKNAFNAAAPRRTAIVLEYRRPWEPKAVRKKTIYFETLPKDSPH